MSVKSLRESVWKPAAAMTVAAGMVLSPAAADDRARPSTTIPTVTNPAEERIVFQQARDDASEYAKEGFNIALVLQPAQDIYGVEGRTPEAVGALFKDHYQTKLDEAYPKEDGGVEVFYAPNPDGKATLVMIYVGDQPFTAIKEKYGLSEEQSDVYLGLMTAWNVADDVVRVLPVAKVLQLQNEEELRTTASLSGAALAAKPKGLD